MVDAEANFERIWKIVPEYWGEAPYPTLTAVGVNWLYGFQLRDQGGGEVAGGAVRADAQCRGQLG
ncbi:putative translation initiation inhibitor [Pseudomonas aeruginosa]|nr:putative translation initiation inhibitor [Pseudomonas aeruginosa]